MVNIPYWKRRIAKGKTQLELHRKPSWTKLGESSPVITDLIGGRVAAAAAAEILTVITHV